MTDLASVTREVAALRLERGVRFDTLITLAPMDGLTALETAAVHIRVERLLRGIAAVLRSYEIDLCPECSYPTVEPPGGGSKCPECGWWFCF